MGLSREDFMGKPVIAILNTWSDLNTCHQHFKQRVEEIKRGVWQAGGFPVEIPVISLSEMYMKPTSMLYRNLLAMEVEEVLRCHPVDGAVLMGGCDKTVPGLIMGAATMNLPAIFMPAGPMLRGNWRGQTLGSGSDVWKYWAERRSGNLSEEKWLEIEDGIARSAGVCMTMGTACTMALIVEAMGLSLPGASSIPAVDSNHSRMASQCGRRIVEMVWEDLKVRDVLTSEAIDNGIITDMAIGGSTNAIVHILAMAGRAGVKLDLSRFDKLSRRTPWLANIRPSGKFLMEDFYYAGGTRGLINRLTPLLNVNARTVSGKTLGEDVTGAEVFSDEVIATLDKPLRKEGGTLVLRGNLAPDGCVIKATAAEERLLAHKGAAVVFKDYNDMAARIDDDSLTVNADSVLVLQSAGPLGAPGMPEWGQLPIPKKLLKQGVRDMVRISDARMSGTSYGACVLHVSPESHIGGPLALVRDGDVIELNAPGRTLTLHVDAAELSKRQAAWSAPAVKYERGYGELYSKHVTQAHLGCDFDFLQKSADIPEPEIH
jgi:dihydroxy-acid dehydratase